MKRESGGRVIGKLGGGWGGWGEVEICVRKKGGSDEGCGI